MDIQDFQEQDFMEILMRLPCSQPFTIERWRAYARMLPTICAYGIDHSRVLSPTYA